MASILSPPKPRHGTTLRRASSASRSTRTVSSRAITKDSAKLEALQSARKAAYAKAQEEAILLAQLARAKGNTFDPASHFPPDGNFGGFVYSNDELARVIERAARLEEARARFAPPPQSADLTMRQIEALIG